MVTDVIAKVIDGGRDLSVSIEAIFDDTRIVGQLGLEKPLSYIEYRILKVLLEFEVTGIRASDLSKAVNRLPTSFTPILDKVTIPEYAERAPDPSDRRAVLIFITAKGKEIVEAMQLIVEPKLRRIENRLKQAEKAQLFAYLERITNED